MFKKNILNIMKKFYKVLPILILLGLIVYFTVEVYASTGGRILRTSTVDGGCGTSGCHSTSTSTATTVSLSSGSTTVEPNSTNTYTIRVSNSTLPKSGINIAVKTSITGNVNIGTLAASGSGLQVLASELTHTSPQDISGGFTDYTFTWTAPEQPGTYYLRAVGLASDNQNNAAGDLWNWMEPKALTVRGIVFSEPKTGAGACVGNPLIIKWQSAGIANIKIELSSNSGATWGITLQESFNAVGGNYTWNIPANFQQGTNYRIRVSDVTDPNRKSEMTGDFVITGQFSVLQHPESKIMCPGESVQLYVITQGTGLKYQWRKNGSTINGATDSTLDVNNVNSGSPGYYGVIVSSSCFSPIISNEAHIEVRDATVIKSQPKPIITCLGETVSFQVDATGFSVKYQWFKENIEIVGETSSTLTIKNVDKDDVASYHCDVIGYCSTIKSSDVTLTINQPAVITLQPVNQTICEKASAAFKITASGMENIYEWYLNDKKINGASNSEYKITNAISSNAGTYYCIVRNNCGAPDTSDKVTLTVNPLPKISSQPQSRIVMVGDKVTFTVTGQNILTYKWKKDGKTIADATETEFTIESAQTSDSGAYECTVTNDCGSVTTTTVLLDVNEPEPGPRVLFSSLIIDFGNVFKENFRDSVVMGFIKNNGNQKLIIDSIRIKSTDDKIYFETDFADSTEVEVGASIDFAVKFTPQTEGHKNAKLMVYSNAIGETPFVDLIGSGAIWDMASNRSKIDFGKILVNTNENVTFRIFNQSDYDISWIKSEYSCNSEEDFHVSSPELPVVVKAKKSQDITVVFEPTLGVDYKCEMSIIFNGTDKTLKVELLGSGNGNSVYDDNYITEFNIYPNPSSKNLTIEFDIPEAAQYKVEIYDNHGKIVRSFSGSKETYNSRIDWDGKDNSGQVLPSGSYEVVLRTGKAVNSLNMILIK